VGKACPGNQNGPQNLGKGGPDKEENMRKRFAALLSVAGATMAVLALMAAMAEARTPAPGYSQFAGCPSPEEKAEVEACFTSNIKGGSVKLGSKTVPIEHPMTFSGGFGAANKTYYNSKGGLTKVRQKVPGGVIGLTGLTWLAELFGIEALTLYAVTEIAGTPSGVVSPPVTLPIKVHLENPGGILGANCYIGSNSEPITLNLITGTTSPPPPASPITGKQPELSASPTNENILLLKNGEFVDNTFAAPGANGCVLTVFGFIPISINGLVNSQSGVPSKAGTNEARQVIDTEITESHYVYP
jgi:hypothetical protein